MVTYKVCKAVNTNGEYKLVQIGMEFESKANAVAYVTGAYALNDYEGVELTILEVYIPE